MSGLKLTSAFLPAEPLRKRVPRRDENGRSFADFMMIIPGLKLKPEHMIQDTVAKLEAALANYRSSVVFVDLNLRLNLLWVTVRPTPGICWDVACAVQSLIPEAVLVANPFVPGNHKPRRRVSRLRLMWRSGE